MKLMYILRNSVMHTKIFQEQGTQSVILSGKGTRMPFCITAACSNPLNVVDRSLSQENEGLWYLDKEKTGPQSFHHTLLKRNDAQWTRHTSGFNLKGLYGVSRHYRWLFLRKKQKSLLKITFENLKSLKFYYGIDSIMQFSLFIDVLHFSEQKKFWIIVILLILSEKWRIFGCVFGESFLFLSQKKSPVHISAIW